MADRSSRAAICLWSGLAVLAAALFAARLAAAWPDASASPSGADELERVIILYGTLPRAVVALLAGATLALSGLLLQRVLRNPLAEPSTLGISAGAQLAMAVATIHAPVLMDLSEGAVAFAGGIAAAAVVLALTWRRGLEPVSVVLAGMMVALTATAASGAIILANGEYLFSLFIWGGGSLVQQDWSPALAIGASLLAGAGTALVMSRALTLLGLDDASARGLGAAINASRLLIIGLAVWMATTVAAQVGLIGFVGLAAPTLATLSGARTLHQKLIAAPLIGAILLWLTDGLVQLAAGPGGERIPTGAATALLGGPLLLWLLPRLRMMEWPTLAAARAGARRADRPGRAVSMLAAATVMAGLCALLIGRGPEGWTLATGSVLTDLSALRLPRIGVAMAAGAMLAAAGAALQRITGNPLASPEVLGVGSGAGVGLAGVLLIDMSAGLGWQAAGSALGALSALALILAIAARSRFGPERLLLGGIAMSAAASAVITTVIALGNVQSYALLRWLSGSTSTVTAGQAVIMLVALVVLAAPLQAAARWLDILPLGASAAESLGMPVRPARAVLIVLAALLSAGASIFIGPLSFAGLIAPHMARLIGFTRAPTHLLGAMLIGALLMVLSDWLSRMAAFPYQLPVGLFAALLGGPYLVYLLAKGVPRRA